MYKIKATFKTVCHCPAGLFNDNIQKKNILYMVDDNNNNSNSHNSNDNIIYNNYNKDI